MTSELFSRERAAGYDPRILEKAIVLLVGCGAAGNNIAQTLALLGVGEVRCVDPDVVERSNLPRSPLFDAARASGKRQRYKAAECASGILAASHAREPVARFAVARIEELGLGAFVDVTVIVAAADSFVVRAWLADATRLLGVPLVELGFAGHRGHVSVWTRQCAESPCWRCAHPRVEHGGVGCTLYARGTSALGLTPATQPLAGIFGNLAAAQVVEAIHDRHGLDRHIVHFDLLTGRSRVVEVTADAACPGVHRRLGDVRMIEVTSDDTAGALLDRLRAFAKDPVVRLPAVYVKSAACHLCGAPVAIGRPEWAVTTPPQCRACPTVLQLGGSALAVASTFEHGDDLSSLRLAQLGLRSAAVLEVEDRASGARSAVRIAGIVDDLFETLRRKGRNTSSTACTKEAGAMDAPKKENASGKAADADQAQVPAPAGLARVRSGGRLGDDGPGRP